MPRALKNKADKLPDGRRICYGYSLGTCPHKVADGAECAKGVHVCANHGCHGSHPVSACTK